MTIGMLLTMCVAVFSAAAQATAAWQQSSEWLLVNRLPLPTHTTMQMRCMQAPFIKCETEHCVGTDKVCLAVDRVTVAATAQSAAKGRAQKQRKGSR